MQETSQETKSSSVSNSAYCKVIFNKGTAEKLEGISVVQVKSGRKFGSIEAPTATFSGKKFKYWKDKSTNTEISESTPISNDMSLIPYFEDESVNENLLGITVTEDTDVSWTDASTEKTNTGTLEYSTDGNNWLSFEKDTSITVTSEKKLYLRGNNEETGFSNITINFAKSSTATSTPEVHLSGCVMSLIYGENINDTNKLIIPTNSIFNCLFSNQSLITSVSENFLPATTLSDYCYQYMFTGCTGLTALPETLLPATSLKQYCYSWMFNYCPNLTSTPALPATTLANNCYEYMFKDCRTLVEAPVLPATTLAQECYSHMFFQCSSLKLVYSLPATTLADSCYNAMFQSCYSLTSAPSLPATTLASSCYAFMFSNCTSLLAVPSLPATTLADSCYICMFQKCTSLVVPPSLPSTTLTSYCYSEMFENCTSLKWAPDLPASELVSGCYEYMFNGCSSLSMSTNPVSSAHKIFTAPSSFSSSAVTDMFKNCSGSKISSVTAGTTYYHYIY